MQHVAELNCNVDHMWYNRLMTLDGSKVRHFLQGKKRSDEWLADQLDCSLRTVGHILAGRMPRGETLVRLAKLMRCRVEDLILSEAMEAS